MIKIKIQQYYPFNLRFTLTMFVGVELLFLVVGILPKTGITLVTILACCACNLCAWLIFRSKAETRFYKGLTAWIKSGIEKKDIKSVHILLETYLQNWNRRESARIVYFAYSEFVFPKKP
jgi:hypothetical protein